MTDGTQHTLTGERAGKAERVEPDDDQETFRDVEQRAEHAEGDDE